MRDERPAEQRDEHVVVAHGELERGRLLGHAVVLGRSAGAGPPAAADGHLEVAAGGQLVEVVAGDVGVQVELAGDLGRGDAVGVLTGEQVDLAPGGVAERRGDGRDRRREVGGGEWGPIHLGIVPMGVGEIPEPARGDPCPSSRPT